MQWLANAGAVLVFPFVFQRAAKEATFSFLGLKLIVAQLADVRDNNPGDREILSFHKLRRLQCPRCIKLCLCVAHDQLMK